MKYNKLFIGGCPRSGTTWVWSIFKYHPQVISTFESFVYDIFLLPFINLDRPFFKARFKEIKNRLGITKVFDSTNIKDQDIWDCIVNLHKVYPSIRLYQYVTPQQIAGFVEEAQSQSNLSTIKKAEYIIESIFDCYYQKSGGTGNNIFVDKTPSNIFHGERILQQFPESKLIEVIRDGRDVCMALEVFGKFWCPRTREKQIRQWRKSIESGMKLKSNKEYSHRIFTVKYEDLKKDTFRIIRDIFQFAQIESSNEIISRVIENTNRVKEKDKVSKKGLPYKRGIVGQWKDNFTSEDIQIIKDIAGDILELLGYTW